MALFTYEGVRKPRPLRLKDDGSAFLSVRQQTRPATSRPMHNGLALAKSTGFCGGPGYGCSLSVDARNAHSPAGDGVAT
jgi:hypothetical protein